MSVPRWRCRAAAGSQAAEPSALAVTLAALDEPESELEPVEPDPEPDDPEPESLEPAAGTEADDPLRESVR